VANLSLTQFTTSWLQSTHAEKKSQVLLFKFDDFFRLGGQKIHPLLHALKNAVHSYQGHFFILLLCHMSSTCVVASVL
jgi:hypothetical protein